MGLKVTIKKLMISAEVELPTVPNFIRFSNGVTVDVKDIDPESLEVIGVMWIQALQLNAKERLTNGNKY